MSHCVRIIRKLYSKMSHSPINDFDCRDSLIEFEKREKIQNFKKIGNLEMYRMLSRRRILKFHQCWRFKSSSPIIPKDRLTHSMTHSI